jgi:hypothetical protein
VENSGADSNFHTTLKIGKKFAKRIFPRVKPEEAEKLLPGPDALTIISGLTIQFSGNRSGSNCCRAGGDKFGRSDS